MEAHILFEEQSSVFVLESWFRFYQQSQSPLFHHRFCLTAILQDALEGQNFPLQWDPQHEFVITEWTSFSAIAQQYLQNDSSVLSNVLDPFYLFQKIVNLPFAVVGSQWKESLDCPYPLPISFDAVEPTTTTTFMMSSSIIPSLYSNFFMTLEQKIKQLLPT